MTSLPQNITRKPKTASFGGVKLSLWSGAPSPLIPSSPCDVVLPMAQKKAIATALSENMTCVLIGETGTGKTSAIRHLAYLRQQPYIRINMNGYTTPDELIGSKSAQAGSTYFEKGILIQAMEMGALLVVDELNAGTPECLFLFHSLLDDERKVTLPNGEVVFPHPEFRFFATMNPDYEGTKSVNRAFIDRFTLSLFIEPMDAKKEEAFLIERVGLNDEESHNMMLFATAFRKVYAEQKTSTFISTRSLIQWGQLVKSGFSLEQAFEFALLGKLRSDEKQGAQDVFTATTKKNMDFAGKDELVIVQKSQVDEANENFTKAKQELLDSLSVAKKRITQLATELGIAKSASKEVELDELKQRNFNQAKRLEELTKEVEALQALKSALKNIKVEEV